MHSTGPGIPQSHMVNSKFLEASTLSQRELLFTPNNNKVLNPHPLPFVIPYHRINNGSRKFLTEIGTS